MKVNHTIDIDNLVDSLLGKVVLAGVDPWRSQIRALSKAITFVENDFFLTNKLLSHTKLTLLHKKIDTRVIGITGLPGAGKSTLTNLFVKELRAQNKTVAVLAVDPSSSISGGAILGDRVRMQDHFRDEYVYIRSMGARGALGGVAKATRAAIRLACLLNFDTILVETVGIGQSESDIIGIADTTMLVLMPNSGDEIQLMKAGVLQLANMYVINKCDLADASRMLQELKENISTTDVNSWNPPVLKASAAKEEGVKQIVEQFFAHADFEKRHPVGKAIKMERAKKEIMQSMISLLEEKFLRELEQVDPCEYEKLLEGKTTAMFLAKNILENLSYNVNV
ncbi:MAG: methylmalonyl Co-A mutase-associated GTPase MeaB [Bdellovibrionota bacterium]